MWWFSLSGSPRICMRWQMSSDELSICHAIKHWATTSSLAGQGEIQQCEKLVVLMYNRTCTLSEINQVRKEHFAKKVRSLQGKAQTLSAMEQQLNWVNYQRGHGATGGVWRMMDNTTWSYQVTIWNHLLWMRRGWHNISQSLLRFQNVHVCMDMHLIYTIYRFKYIFQMLKWKYLLPGWPQI